ncbi:MAG: dihydrolipoyl dehydrogenase [Thermodesulfobacteriota bacterium]
MREFNLVVIGGGPGGYVAAIRGAQLGGSVALIEKAKVGGTCLNRGCIPTKALYYSAKSVKAVKGAAEFGVTVSDYTFDMAGAVERKDGVVDKLVSGVRGLLKGNGVEVIEGTGFIEGAGRVRVRGEDGESETIAAGSIIIATGSEPALIPAFKIDGENVITSTEALDLKELPKSMLIIGGGVMGCEFATIFSAFGTDCIVVELLDGILATEDRMVSRVIAKGFKASGVNVMTGVLVEDVSVLGEKQVKTTLKGGHAFITEKVLVTIGRAFNSVGLGLTAAGVEVEKGRIVVDERLETSLKGVYAIGDVTGKMLLAHVASVQGGIAAANALGKSETMDYSAIPYGIFTDPEIASVGLKEKEAKEQGIDVSVGRFPYAASGKALGMGETEGFVQILSDKGTDVVLGASIVGAHATDIIGEVALAVKAALKTEDIIDTVHAHPTLPELVLEAAEDVHGVAVHKLGRKRR